MKKLSLIVILAIAFAGWFVVTHNRSESPAQKETGQAASFNKSQYSLTDPASLWVIVNKQRPLSNKNYKPSDLVAPNVPLRLPAGHEEMQMRAAGASAVEAMFAAAKRENIRLMVSSAFRSYSYQSGLYSSHVKNQGQESADTQSARPGFSEHQTGWAVDVEPSSRKCEIEECFANTPEGQWVAKNAYKYGFVIRYQKDKQDITGYIFEPWHLRYVGKKLSTEIEKRGNLTLEEFFGLASAPNYL